MSTQPAFDIQPLWERLESIPVRLGRPRRLNGIWITILPLAFADAVAALLGCILACVSSAGMTFEHAWAHALLSTAFSLACFAVCRPYPGSFLHPAEEWRRIFWSLGVGATLFGTVCYFHSISAAACAAVALEAWAIAIVALIVLRAASKHLLAQCDWWGVRTVVIGGGQTGADLFRTLRSRREWGLRVVGWLGDGAGPDARSADSYRQEPGEALPDLGRLKAECAVIATSGLRVDELSATIERWGPLFRRMFLTWDMDGISGLETATGGISDLFGISVNRNLLYAGPRILKRSLDLVAIAALSPLSLPLLGVLWALVKLTSAGPAFYGQRRIGRNGIHLTVWKFRTMIVDADSVLNEYLKGSPELRREWLLTHKLKNDHRITPIGRVLRKTSLDELPQLWNVLRGDMSLVGPRPIVDNEVDHYAADYHYYQQVRPGITGLWQVSGRNNISYAERVAFDRCYVRNWSLWLDMYILARTVRTVLTGHGAY